MLQIRPSGTSNFTTIINDWTAHGPTDDYGSYALTAGQSYDVILSYFQASGGAEIRLFWSSPSTPDQVICPLVQIGNNLSSSEFVPFVNRMWSANAFWNHGTLDGNGNLTSDGDIYVWQGSPGSDGTYKVIFNGQAQVSVGLGYASFPESYTTSDGNTFTGVYNAATNTTTATMIYAPTGSTNCDMFFTNTRQGHSGPVNTGISNIKIISPISEGSTTTYSGTDYFQPGWKSEFSLFTVFRTMPFIGTNYNAQNNDHVPETTWNTRIQPNAQIQQEFGFYGGLAWEYVIQAANETGRDLWINIPEDAVGTDPTDKTSYIYNLAELVSYGSDANGNVYTSPQSAPVHPPLNPNLKLYIEYANEVWNPNFSAYHSAYTLGTALGSSSPINYDGQAFVSGDGSSDFNRVVRFDALRTKQISDIFRAVVGSGQMLTRIRPVLEWQLSNGSASGSRELEFLDNYYNNADGQQHVSNPTPVNTYIYGGGTAPYYYSGNDNAGTEAGIIASGLPAPGYGSGIQQDVDLALTFGIKPCNYEGGMGVGHDNKTAAQVASYDDPAAGTSLVTATTIAYKYGDGIYMNGTYAMTGNNIYTLNTPLLNAVKQISETLPPDTSDPNYVIQGPTTINGADCQEHSYNPSGPYLYFRGSLASTASYFFNIPTAGTYTLTINVSTDVASNTYGIRANGGSIQTVSVGNTNSNATNAPSVTVSLNAGINAVQVSAYGTTDGNLNSLAITSGSGGSQPTITSQPGNATVNVGQSATFSVTAGNNPTGYQWYFNNSPISGAISSSYSISNAQTANAGSYYVIVSNGNGTTQSNNATLTVNSTTGGGGVLIDVQFGGNTFSSGQNSAVQTGAAQVGSSGDQWNDITNISSLTSGVSLSQVNGSSSGVTLTVTPDGGAADLQAWSVGSGGGGGSVLQSTSDAALFQGFMVVDYGHNTGGNVVFSGLSAGTSYNLYVYSAPNASRSVNVSLNGGASVAVGPNNGATALSSSNNYVLLSGTADSTGKLTLRTTLGSGGEMDINGFQLQQAGNGTPPPSGRLLDVQIGGNTFSSGQNSAIQSGAAKVGTAGDQWNYITNISLLTSGVALNQSSGVASGVSLTVTPDGGSAALQAWSVGSSGGGGSVLQSTSDAALFQGFLVVDYGHNTGGNIVFSGLTPNAGYNLYVYSAPNASRSINLALNGGTTVTVGPNNSATTLTSPNNYTLLSGNADSSGRLTLRTTLGTGGEMDINGLQLQAR